MKLNLFLIINAVIAAVFGIIFALIPAQAAQMYGLTATASLNYVTRLFGIALIGIAVLSWLVKNVADSDARKAILLAFLVMDALGFVWTLIGQLRGVVNTLGWLSVVIYLLLAVGFGYFRFANQRLVNKP